MSKIASLLLSIVALMLLVLPASCAESDGGFGIYLADSGELVLSLEHIEAYHSLDSSLELNAGGIKRWNSYQTYTAGPKLAQSLYRQEFILKTGEEEICRGIFDSMLSSYLYDGVVIRESVLKLDDESKYIVIEVHYFDSSSDSEEARIKAELEAFFSARDMLAADYGRGSPQDMTSRLFDAIRA
jgi:hypothetical protein